MTTCVRTLLVEDNPGDADLTRELLEEGPWNIEVTIVPNGAEAVSRLLRQPPYESEPLPDLILLDLNLPGLSGAGVLEQRALHPELRRIPVLVLTSSDARSDIRQSYELGANCYLIKPMGLSAFQETVQAIGHFWVGLARLQ